MNSRKCRIQKITHGVFLTMTEKLYYNDAYISEFKALVISCEKEGEGYVAVLDRTAFFPEEGGQYSDRGFLSDSRVYDVKERDGIIYHYIDSPLNAGESVNGKIDFDERVFSSMQEKSAVPYRRAYPLGTYS